MNLEFVTSDIRNFLEGTNVRMEEMIKLPEPHKKLLIIDKVNVGEKWQEFYEHMKPQVQGLDKNIQLSQEDAYKLAFYLDFVALFYKYFQNQEKGDEDYVNYVGTFFKMHKEDLSAMAPDQEYVEDGKWPRNETELFKRAFPQ